VAIVLDKSIVELPNIKKIFIPDPNYVLFDADLSGADAQVVAWEADDDELKALFRRGENVHVHNAVALFGDRWHKAEGAPKAPGSPKALLYQDCKKAVHATNYIGSARTVAGHLGWMLHEAEDFQRRWFKLHPGIRDWHDRVRQELRLTNTVRNKMGYHRTYFDRSDSVLPQAIAWVPQSTIALTCFRGLLQLEIALPHTEILLQTHDSGTFQIPKHHITPPHTYEDIHAALSNVIPYDDPLIIKWKLEKSEKSWGECEEIK